MTPSMLWIPIGLYLAGWLLEFLRYWRAGTRIPALGGGLLAAGWGAHSLLVAAMLYDAGLTLSNLLLVVAWVAMVGYYVMLLRLRQTVFGFIVPPFAVAVLLVSDVLSLNPLLFSAPPVESELASRGLLIVHIVAVLAGHLLFALACLISILYLYQEHQIKAKLARRVINRLPSLGALTAMNHQAIALGFFFLSGGILLGILVGGVDTLPERLLSWRQIIPTLTWAVYAAFLLEHALRGLRGRFAALWSIAGFVVVVSSMVFEMFALFGRA